MSTILYIGLFVGSLGIIWAIILATLAYRKATANEAQVHHNHEHLKLNSMKLGNLQTDVGNISARTNSNEANIEALMEEDEY